MDQTCFVCLCPVFSCKTVQTDGCSCKLLGFFYLYFFISLFLQVSSSSFTSGSFSIPALDFYEDLLHENRCQQVELSFGNILNPKLTWWHSQSKKKVSLNGGKCCKRFEGVHRLQED